MAKPTLDLLKAEAAKVGATIDDEGMKQPYLNEAWVLVDAPNGKQWATDGGLHALAVVWYTDQPKTKGEAIKYALERMAEGLIDCPADCDACE